MKSSITILFLFFSIVLFAQDNYEEGYYINNAGERIEGYINNADWTSHPKKIDFKSTFDAQTQSFNVEDIQEFALTYGSKFKRFTVDIDQSIRASLEPDYNAQPVFKRDQVMLEVLVEGAGNLYAFVESGRDIFFMETETVPVQQFIYKKYLSDNDKKRTNYEYRKQISQHLVCQDIGLEDFKNIPYSRNALIDLFVKYNKCQGVEPTLYERYKAKAKGTLTLIAGLDLSRLKYTRGGFNATPLSQDLDPFVGQRLGLSGEIILPRDNNRWAILGELSFIFSKVNQATPRGNFNIDYKGLDLAFGLRHNFYLNEKNRIYANIGLSAHAPLSSTFEIEDSFIAEVKNTTTFFGGLGYRFAEKIMLELRFGMERDLLKDVSAKSTKFYTNSLMVGWGF